MWFAVFAVAINSNFLFYFKGLREFGGFCGVGWVLFLGVTLERGCLLRGGIWVNVLPMMLLFWGLKCSHVKKGSVETLFSEPVMKVSKSFDFFSSRKLQAQFIKFQTVCCQYQPIILRIRLVRLRNPHRFRIQSWSNLFCWLPTFYGPTSNVNLPKPLQCFNVYFLTINFPYPRSLERVSEFHTEHATTAAAVMMMLLLIPWPGHKTDSAPEPDDDLQLFTLGLRLFFSSSSFRWPEVCGVEKYLER